MLDSGSGAMSLDRFGRGEVRLTVAIGAAVVVQTALGLIWAGGAAVAA